MEQQVVFFQKRQPVSAFRMLAKKLENLLQPVLTNERWVALAFAAVFLFQALILATLGLGIWLSPPQTSLSQSTEHRSLTPPPHEIHPNQVSDTSAENVASPDFAGPEGQIDQPHKSIDTKERSESNIPIVPPKVESPKLDPRNSLAQKTESFSRQPNSQMPTSPLPASQPQSTAMPIVEADGNPDFNRLKNATAFVETDKNSFSNSISQAAGLLVMKQGAAGYIVVPNRFISMSEKKTCYFREGSSSISCEIDQSKSRVCGSMMLLYVKHKDLPEPVDLSDVAELQKSMPVTVITYPTVTSHHGLKHRDFQEIQSKILKLKQSESGCIERIQLDNLLDYRDLGGPVVNANGKFVGLAAPRIDNFGEEPFTDWVIPHNKITELLEGTIGEVKATLSPDNVYLYMSFIDPCDKITSGVVLFCKKESLRKELPDEKATQPGGENMHEMELKFIDTGSGKMAAIYLGIDASSDEWYYQLRIDRSDGTRQFGPTVKIEKSPPETKLDRFSWTAPAEANVQIPSEPFLLSSFEKNAISQFGYFNINANKLLPTMVLSSDASKLIVADKKGMLYAFSTEDRRELLRCDLKYPCTSLGSSTAGIVAVCENQIIVIGESDFAARQLLNVSGVKELACHPNSPMAYFYRESDHKMVAVNLQTGDVLAFQENFRSRIEALSLSPDGRFLLGFEHGKVCRFRVSGNKLKLEQTVNLQTGGRLSGPAIISPDAKFVPLTFDLTEVRPSGTVEQNKGMKICPITDLETPEFTLDGASSSCIAFDPTNNKIYSGYENRFLVFSNRKKESTYAIPVTGIYSTTEKESLVALLGHPQGNRVFVLTNFRLISALLAEPIRQPDSTANSAPKPETQAASSTVSPPSASAEKLKPDQRDFLRTWTDKSGQFRVVAKLIEVDKENVVLLELTDGTHMEIDLDQLSELDQKFLTRS